MVKLRLKGFFSIVLQEAEVDEFVRRVNYPLGKNSLFLVIATLVKRMLFVRELLLP